MSAAAYLIMWAFNVHAERVTPFMLFGSQGEFLCETARSETILCANALLLHAEG